MSIRYPAPRPALPLTTPRSAWIPSGETRRGNSCPCLVSESIHLAMTRFSEGGSLHRWTRVVIASGLIAMAASCGPPSKAPERKVDLNAELRQATQRYADLVAK